MYKCFFLFFIQHLEQTQIMCQYSVALQKNKYTLLFKSDVFIKEKTYFIQWGGIKLIKSDSKDIYNVTKYSYFKKCCSSNYLFHKNTWKQNKAKQKNTKKHSYLYMYIATQS